MPEVIVDAPNQLSALDQPTLHAREPLQPGCTGVGISLDVETIQPKKISGQFVYSAKFLCGRIPHSPDDPQDPPLGFPLVPGSYRTAINVNNPNLEDVTFTKMALTTNPESQPRGKAGTPVEETLAPNEGLEIDCLDIEALLTTGSGFDLFNNSNTGAVFNNPPAATVFTLNRPAVVKQLITYHWNGGAGAPPGTIGLMNSAGVLVGRFNAQGVSGQGGAPNVNWVAQVGLLLQPDTYVVVDSNPQTWSYNQQSQAAGFAIVRGSNSFVGSAPFFKGFVVIRSPVELDVVGVYTVKNVISAAPSPPRPAPQQQCPPITVTVELTPHQDTYHLNHLIGITAVIAGGQPPYNPVTVTLTSIDLRTPYSIGAGSSPTTQYSQNWNVYLSGPTSPGTWGTLRQCSISISVTDANGCKGTGGSQAFTLDNP